MGEQPPALAIAPCDPHAADAAILVRELSAELARRYDFIDDGSGDFKPEDATVPGSGFLVGRLAAEPVACGAFRPLEPGIAEVKRMFVMPAHRGRGHSKRILAEIERRAAACGHRVLRIETGDRQPEAIALYERSGYRRIPNFGSYAGRPHSVCFEKRL